MAKRNEKQEKKSKFIKFLNFVIPIFTTLSSIGFWVFLTFFFGIHWAHIVPFIHSDFDIKLDNPKYDIYYKINDSFTNTFILSNKWAQSIDAGFDITKNDCVILNFSCNTITNDCPKSLNLGRAFMFSEISNDAPKYITVSGTFTNCTGEQKICLYVDEPKSHSNAKQSCLKFNPSPITG